jgi:tetratricopeptide (TPR) repeat protein
VDQAGQDQPCEARIRLYEQALGRDPRNHLLLIDLAREYGLHQRFLDADEMLLRVLELYPRSGKVRSQVAAAYLRIGLPQQAREQFQMALVLDPLHSEATAIRVQLSSLDV